MPGLPVVLVHSDRAVLFQPRVMCESENCLCSGHYVRAQLMPVSATSEWGTLIQGINGPTMRDDHACVSVHTDSTVISISSSMLASSMCSGTAGKLMSLLPLWIGPFLGSSSRVVTGERWEKRTKVSLMK